MDVESGPVKSFTRRGRDESDGLGERGRIKCAKLIKRETPGKYPSISVTKSRSKTKRNREAHNIKKKKGDQNDKTIKRKKTLQERQETRLFAQDVDAPPGRVGRSLGTSEKETGKGAKRGGIFWSRGGKQYNHRNGGTNRVSQTTEAFSYPNLNTRERTRGGSSRGKKKGRWKPSGEEGRTSIGRPESVRRRENRQQSHVAGTWTSGT